MRPSHSRNSAISNVRPAACFRARSTSSSRITARVCVSSFAIFRLQCTGARPAADIRAFVTAHLASEAAGQQGRFWQMHDLLYREQAVWSKAADVRPLFDAYAGMLGLKIDRFKKDMESDEAKRKIDADQQQGAALGVTVTLTIFINNRALPRTSLNEAGLRAAVEAAMKAKSAP